MAYTGAKTGLVQGLTYIIHILIKASDAWRIQSSFLTTSLIYVLNKVTLLALISPTQKLVSLRIFRAIFPVSRSASVTKQQPS